MHAKSLLVLCAKSIKISSNDIAYGEVLKTRRCGVETSETAQVDVA